VAARQEVVTGQLRGFASMLREAMDDKVVTAPAKRNSIDEAMTELLRGKADVLMAPPSADEVEKMALAKLDCIVTWQGKQIRQLEIEMEAVQRQGNRVALAEQHVLELRGKLDDTGDRLAAGERLAGTAQNGVDHLQQKCRELGARLDATLAALQGVSDLLAEQGRLILTVQEKLGA
jgi:DNA-binding FrmR family transcriptional regulator